MQGRSDPARCPLVADRSQIPRFEKLAASLSVSHLAEVAAQAPTEVGALWEESTDL